MLGSQRIQGNIKHVLYQSYNWKDENMNITTIQQAVDIYIVVF